MHLVVRSGFSVATLFSGVSGLPNHDSLISVLFGDAYYQTHVQLYKIIITALTTQAVAHFATIGNPAMRP